VKGPLTNTNQTTRRRQLTATALCPQIANKLLPSRSNESGSHEGIFHPLGCLAEAYPPYLSGQGKTSELRSNNCPIILQRGEARRLMIKDREWKLDDKEPVESV